MKKITLSLIAIVFAINFSYAQWTAGTGGNYYLTSGNAGIGTTTPTTALQIGDFLTGSPSSQLLIPGTYNFEQVRLGQLGNGNAALEFVNHNGQLSSYGIKLLVDVDHGAPGLQFQYAPPGTAYSGLSYTTGWYMNLSGNIGIGTTSPNATLDVAGKIRALAAGSYNDTNSQLSAGIVDSTATYSGVQIVARFHNNSNGGIVKLILTDDQISDAYITYKNDPNPVNRLLGFGANNSYNSLAINGSGNVLIGQTTQVNTTYKLDVAGPVRANEIVVNTNGADFVFEPTYKLPSISSVEKYIKNKHHLPEIPSAKQMQNDGLSVGENQVKLLQKVEELTLYLIELKKENEALKQTQKTINHKLKLHHIN